MSEETEITVGYTREGDDIHHLAIGSSALPDIKIDYTGIPQSQRANTATKLLSAAALYCFASTLGGALKARGANIKSLTGKAVATKGRDDYYRTKLTGVRIEVNVDLDEADLPILEKCQNIMEHGCLITYSLGDGIAMEHSIVQSPNAGELVAEKTTPAP